MLLGGSNLHVFMGNFFGYFGHLVCLDVSVEADFPTVGLDEEFFRTFVHVRLQWVVVRVVDDGSTDGFANDVNELLPCVDGY